MTWTWCCELFLLLQAFNVQLSTLAEYVMFNVHELFQWIPPPPPPPNPTHPPTHTPHTDSISWVLMIIRIKKPAHQQLSYLPASPVASALVKHYSDVIMGTIVSQITSVSIVYSIVCSGADQRKHQSSALLAFVQGIHRWLVNSPHKWPVMWKMFPFDDVIMTLWPFDAIQWHIWITLGSGNG